MSININTSLHQTHFIGFMHQNISSINLTVFIIADTKYMACVSGSEPVTTSDLHPLPTSTFTFSNHVYIKQIFKSVLDYYIDVI